jgi:hypothetical protein
MNTLLNINHQASQAELWIAYGPEAVHYGSLANGQALSSGLPNFETFPLAGEANWRARLADLGQVLPKPPMAERSPWLAGLQGALGGNPDGATP